jgi:hypothetical protein
VPHVGVQGLAARDHEEYTAEDGERLLRMLGDQARRPVGIDAGEHRRVARDGDTAERCEREEPQDHHVAEATANASGALVLQGEQYDDDGDGHRNRGAVECRAEQFQALDGAEYRDRRCDQRIAVEQCRAQRGEQHDTGGPASPAAGIPLQQGQHRQDAAFAGVVGAQDQQDVLERDDQRQAPQGQRQHAEHRRGRGFAGGVQRFAEGVQGTGADVAIDGAERADDGRRGQWSLFHLDAAVGELTPSCARCPLGRRQEFRLRSQRDRLAERLE